MLVLREKNDDFILGVWQIKETKDMLLSLLTHRDGILSLTSNMKIEAKIIERIAARVLLKELLNEEKEIGYHPTGKPYMKDNSFQISISHTNGYVAVILSQHNPVGIDIEYKSVRVQRVASKFVNDNEYIDPQNKTDHLLLHWTAKEAIYKLISQNGIDFKNGFHVHKFNPANMGEFLIQEQITKKQQFFTVNYHILDLFVLSYIVG